jgi:hypothetical protein
VWGHTSFLVLSMMVHNNFKKFICLSYLQARKVSSHVPGIRALGASILPLILELFRQCGIFLLFILLHLLKKKEKKACTHHG